MKLKLQRFRISAVLNSLFFPLTSPEIFEAISKRGFEIIRPPFPLPTGPRVYVSGAIARSGDIIIDADDNRRHIGVSAGSIEDALKAFSEVLNMLKEDFFVNLDTELDYVELIAHYLIESDSNPFKVLQSCSEIKFKDKLQQILNTTVSEYRISIVPKEILPSSRKWFEISISPKLTMPTKAYWVEVVFRDKVARAVMTFASNLNSTISNIINTLEGSA